MILWCANGRKQTISQNTEDRPMPAEMMYKVTQADVASVLRAVEQTSTPIEVIIETDGKIRIVPHEGGKDDSLPSKESKPKSRN